MWFESLLVFILFKFKKNVPTFPEFVLYYLFLTIINTQIKKIVCKHVFKLTSKLYNFYLLLKYNLQSGCHNLFHKNVFKHTLNN